MNSKKQSKTVDYFKLSLALHKKLGGKIEMRNKAAARNLADLSVWYTPGVGAVASAIAKDKALAWDVTMKKNSIAIVSDGSAVLGLGNLGPEAAMPVMEGKAMLFKAFANIDAVPIVLNTQEPEEIIRVVKALAPNFGGINLEDISAPRCFFIEERLRQDLEIPVMHDDQHCTAIVVLAALMNALKVVHKRMDDVKIIISGAGAAGVAVAKLLLHYGAANISMTDKAGALHANRADLNSYQQQLALKTNLKSEKGGLKDVIKGADVFIGVSGPRVLSADMVKTMSSRPIVFAMANPFPEIMPAEAKKAGAFIMATGRSDFPNQINNALAFPGMFRGALDARVRHITDAMKIRAAEYLSALVKRPSRGEIIPAVFSKDVAKKVAQAVIDLA